jgi:SAM-dependent methyltransferase
MHCPYCKGTRVKSQGWHKGEFTLHRCADCKNLFVLPLLTKAAVTAYYQNSYSGRTDAHVPKVPAPLTSLYAALIKKWHPIASVVYEVGPSEGHLLYGLKGRGYAVRGYELSEHSANVGKRILGVDIVAGPLPEEQKDKADVLISSHTAEHLIDPKSEFAAYAENLKAGGILVITVPNAASLLFRLAKYYHPWYAQPDHLFYFTPENLVGDLMAAGFKIKKIFTRSDKFSFGVFVLLTLRNWLVLKRHPQKPETWKTLLTTPEARPLEARERKAHLLTLAHYVLWIVSKPAEWILAWFNLNEELWIIAERQ